MKTVSKRKCYSLDNKYFDNVYLETNRVPSLFLGITQGFI